MTPTNGARSWDEQRRVWITTYQITKEWEEHRRQRRAEEKWYYIHRLARRLIPEDRPDIKALDPDWAPPAHMENALGRCPICAGVGPLGLLCVKPICETHKMIFCPTPSLSTTMVNPKDPISETFNDQRGNSSPWSRHDRGTQHHPHSL